MSTSLFDKDIIHVKEGESGIITLKSFDLSEACRRALEIDLILKDAQNFSKEMYDDLVKELSYLCRFKTRVVKNRVVQGARSMQVGRLVNVTTYTGIVNYGAIGTGSTAVTDTDTLLDTESARKPVAARSQTNDQGTIDFYFSKSDAAGTFDEFGMFIDGTASADTGLMFNRTLTGSWVKSALQSLTVSNQININAA